MSFCPIFCCDRYVLVSICLLCMVYEACVGIWKDVYIVTLWHGQKSELMNSNNMSRNTNPSSSAPWDVL